MNSEKKKNSGLIILDTEVCNLFVKKAKSGNLNLYLGILLFFFPCFPCSFQGTKKSARSFSDRSFFMDVRAGCPFQNACFYRIWRAWPKFLAGCPQGYPAQKLPLWAEFSFLVLRGGACAFFFLRLTTLSFASHARPDARHVTWSAALVCQMRYHDDPRPCCHPASRIWHVMGGA